ncbi:MAG: hypothetical protein JWM59_4012 [Verrucomicrobiales bacterium]|nr:hypothetical protein [Verrucomicrobiales bacterium]
MTGDRDQFGTALGLSALVNAGLFLAVVWAMAVERGLLAHARSPAASTPEAVVEMVISAEPEPALRLPEPELAPMVKEKKKPKLQPGSVEAPEDAPEETPENRDTAFVSSRNMRAASELEPSRNGVDGLPRLDGDPDVPMLELRDQDFRDGTLGGNSSALAAAPVVIPSMALPPAMPVPPTATDADRPPETAAPPAFKDPLSPGIPAPPPSRPNRSQAMTAPSSITGETQGEPALRTQLRIPRADGNTTRKGTASVDAQETASGRYTQALRGALNKSWRPGLKGIKDLASRGVVEVYCEIDAAGKTHNVRLLNPGEANPIMQDNAVTAVIKIRFPAPPAELLQDPDHAIDGRLRQTISLLFY